MSNLPTHSTNLEPRKFKPADPILRQSDETFEGLITRILSLALRLQNTETLSGKANLLCNELARMLFRRTMFCLVLDQDYQLIASSMVSQSEKDYLAFEQHLVVPPNEKKKFYTYVKTLKQQALQDVVLVDNYWLFEQVKAQGIEVHKPIEVKQRESSEKVSAKMVACYLFEMLTLKDDFGAYIVSQSQHAKVNLVLYLGGGTEKVCNNEAQTQWLCQTLEFVTKQIATLFESDETKRKAIQDAEVARSLNEFASQLTAGIRAIKAEKDARKKLDMLCQSVAKPKFFDAAVAIVFSGENLSELSAASASEQRLEVAKSMASLISADKFPSKYWEKMKQFGEKIADSFVMLDAVIEDEESPLAFPALCNVFKLLGHRESESSVTFFTPFLNYEGEVFGFIAYCSDTIPVMVEGYVMAVEALIRAVENDLQPTMPRTTSLAELKKWREFAEQAAIVKLQESLNFSKSLSGYATRQEKIQTTLKAICQKTDSKQVKAFFFNKQGDYVFGFECDEQSVSEIPKQDFSKAKAITCLPNRFTLETILSCIGFELSGSFCFTPSQVERVMEGILTSGSIPREFLSPDILKENLQKFANATEAFLLTPVRYRGEIFGYVVHEPFVPTSESESVITRYGQTCAMSSFFARELGYELAIETLKERNEARTQQIQLMEDLNEALFESAMQFETSASLEKRANAIAEALTEKFGFQFASVVFYEDGKTISVSSYQVHSQWLNSNEEKKFAQRFQKGMPVPTNLLNAVFQDNFKVEWFYVYQTSDVKKVYRAKQAGKALEENFGKSALKKYISGDERVAIIIPLFDESQRRVGHISLGQVMLSNLEMGRLSFSERMKQVSVLVKQLELSMRSYLTACDKDIANENLRRSEARYRNLVENVTYGCIIFDAEGKIQFVNMALKGVLGYAIEAMKDKRLEHFVAIKSLDKVKQVYEQVYKRKIQSDTELILVASSGEEVPFQVSFVPQLIVGKAGELELEGAFAVLIDLRPHYEIEKKKQQLENIKKNFYAMVVHDMKVPLAAIYGYSEMMKDAVPSQMDPQHFQDIMTQIYRSSINITNLIQEILEFSKYESRAVDLDIHLNDLILCIELVIEQNQLGMSEKELQVVKNFEPIEKFYFDFTRIARVISNLMSNAIKFSKRKSYIVVSIKKIYQSGKPFVQCAVKDFGEGIPASELESIFDAYRQAQSKHGSRGTGLGLSIAKQIVELHGGNIWAESVLGEGATLTFTLPIRTTLS
ncbi:MAG: ATP-binding protein [Chloroherpetonaceae bacterium]